MDEGKLNKITNFIEKYLLYVFFLLYTVCTVIFCIFYEQLMPISSSLYEVMKYFYSQKEIVITSATVLIGIYFTMYTIFAVYNSSSVIGKLYNTGFQALLKLLKHAMVSSVLVLLFGFLSDWLFVLTVNITYLLNLFLNLYLLLTSIICGFYIYIIFKQDIAGLKEQKTANEEKEVVLQNLRTFLEREQKKEDNRLDKIE
ncbi:hypothetical protein [Listeria seeligeri]|uniref:hypothetical protein n=1 Tax=Listeria seeligeri TaxID=1640 RepID=UPI001627FC9C|nr:hypothetical protein [Listeria seeligeri]MBC1824213.1 hypothetical protein [Listeria seeligeri]MBC1837853.1 hypothetical protein [Listeria seeligeri]